MLYTLHTTLLSLKDTREVSSSHRGALGFLISMLFLQSFRFETLLIYELKVDSFREQLNLQHSQIGLLINNSIRFSSSMHIGFVSMSIHEDL
jgi:hypothetical protein